MLTDNKGRLYQVEYAMEAIGHAGTALGIVAKDGIVLAAERKIISKLLDDEHTSYEKIYILNEYELSLLLFQLSILNSLRNILAAVAGITADANILINNARLDAQRHQLQYGEMIPVEQMAERLCDIKQGYTQYGGTFNYYMCAYNAKRFATIWCLFRLRWLGRKLWIPIVSL